MNHYLYLLTFPDGRKYVGARSTKLPPELDASYLGSGKALPERTRHTCIKEILGEYPNRRELLAAETKYIDDHDCVNSTGFYNLRRRNYDKHGKGHEYYRGGNTPEAIARANIIRRTYVGSNRTPAQLAHDARMRGKKTGPCEAKGHPGISNSAFKPWFYITPEGTRIEVRDCTKKDYAKILGVTPRQLQHRFHKTNIGKKASHPPLKGYLFDYIV